MKQAAPGATLRAPAIRAAALVTLSAVFGAPAPAQGASAVSYPERPVRLIDPYAPGGGSGLIKSTAKSMIRWRA